MFRPVTSKVSFPKLEEEILRLWQEKNIFERSVQQRQGKGRFILYEGPPTANARPGIHHVLARVFKDIIPRYKTMKGFYAPRRGGWDTHGLPVELEVERKLGFSSKRQIEEYGVGRFNQLCRDSVFSYVKDWEALTDRIGFWVDMEHAYITLDNDYIETGWWILKQLWEKGLIYQGSKVTPHCPRCGTTLSSHEVALGYKDDAVDPSIYIKFKLDLQRGGGTDEARHLLASSVPTYLLAWTTTPWTLPGNTALAVGPQVDYALVEYQNGEGRRERLILAQALLPQALKHEYEIIATIKGEELRGLVYEPLFDPREFATKIERFQPSSFDSSRVEPKTVFRKGSPGPEGSWPSHQPLSFPIITGDFVSTQEGTGIVHIAPAFGEVDYEAGRENQLYMVQQVDLEGKITGAYPFAGKFVKEADPLVLDDLKSRGLLYRSEKITHTYPFCWRCSSPLLYYAKSSWYIRTTALKEQLIAGNERINWYPEHIKRGRFGDWLENNVDWAFSRERYWGTPVPVWRCQGCGHWECIGSRDDLRRLAHHEAMAKEGHTIDECLKDLHRPFVDDIILKCPESKAGRAHHPDTMRRVPEVMDCWFDSGAMPFAQAHYPFENKDRFVPELFPADYICEAVDQTRGWFYSLHAISTLLMDRPSFKNVICLGHILDQEGEKMSKSKGNVVDPQTVLDQHGADALRWYLFTASPPGNVRRFSAALVGEAVRQFLLPLWNTYSFFVTYANIDKFDPRATEGPYRSELDRWVLSELNQLIQGVDKALEGYDPTDAGRQLQAFVDNLSDWYVRRSRRRFWKSENDQDKQAAYATLYQCLVTLAKLLAPFTPFLAEELYQNLVRPAYPEYPESIHLMNFPIADPSQIDQRLAEDTRLAMKIASLGRAARSQAGIKVRQPLARVLVKVPSQTERKALKTLAPQVMEELNVKGLEPLEDEARVMSYEVKPNLPLLGPKYGKELGRISKALNSLPPQEVAARVQGGHKVEAGGYSLEPQEVLVTAKAAPGYEVAQEGGYLVAVDTRIAPELKDEGTAREIVHRLQTMRRSAGFDIADYITTYYQAGPALKRVMERFEAYIRQETLSRALVEGPPPDGSYQETHRLEGQEIILAVKRLG